MPTPAEPTSPAAASAEHPTATTTPASSSTPNEQPPLSAVGEPDAQESTAYESTPCEAGTSSSQEPGAAAEAPAEDPEVTASKLQAAEEHKQKGNEHYRAGQYNDALDSYREAVEAAPHSASEQLAVYWANAAACHLQLEQAPDCVHCCSAALEHSPNYLKALLRRSTAYERLDELDKALRDAQHAVECDPECGPAAAAVKRLRPIVEERNEKLKEETLGKLKDLGNTLLGKFGLSLDNFQAEKDPTTGSYSFKFNNS